MAYTFDQAAALLNMGRNNLIRSLRDAGMLGRDNLPAGRYRGHRAFTVQIKTFRHSVTGYSHYGRTLITEEGLDIVARQIGVPVIHNQDTTGIHARAH